MKKGIFLIAILLVPSVVYMLFSLGKHNTARLGFYGAIEKISDNGDTIYTPIALPSLLDNQGKIINESTLNNKVLVLHRFNWPCDDHCTDNIATLNNYLNKVELKDEWQLASVCVDPIEQNQLRALETKRIYNGDNWGFYSLENAEASTQISDIFNVIPNIESSEENVVLIDQSLRIRAFFNIRTQQDNKMLQGAIKVLIQEPHISWKEKK